MNTQQKVESPGGDFKSALEGPTATVQIKDLKRRAADSELIASNLGLVKTLARRYAGYCTAAVDVEDLVQVGCLGLIEAQKSFDPDRAAWSTWAAYYIRAAMRRTLGRGKSPPCVSLDAPLSEETEDALRDLLPDKDAPSPEAEAVRSDRQRQVRAAVEGLGREEVRFVIRRKYLDGLTYAQIAEELDVPAARVAQLAAQGRERLAREKHLLAYLDEHTNFEAHKSVAAFNRDWTSIVEAAVLWREQMRERIHS